MRNWYKWHEYSLKMRKSSITSALNIILDLGHRWWPRDVDEQLRSITVFEWSQPNCEPKLNPKSPKTTHLSSINIQGHVETVVSGHQVSPDVGPVPLVTIDSGGFYGSVCAKHEVEPCIFGASRFHSADAYRPALLTQWVGTVVKYTCGKGSMGTIRYIIMKEFLVVS